MKTYTADGLLKLSQDIAQLDDVVELLKTMNNLLIAINLEQKLHTVILNSSLLEGKIPPTIEDLLSNTGDSSSEGVATNAS